jgi:AmmeMemoRadiSam system protein A
MTSPESEPQLSLGEAAVRLARNAIEFAFRNPPGTDAASGLGPDPIPPALRSPHGVFVSLKSFPGGRLRGCIGFPLPVFPLHVAIARAAAAAALEDPRFPALSSTELPRVTLEVSILSVPERIEGLAEHREAEVVVGRHGLMVDSGSYSGLLLPQVAVEEAWTPRRFLEATCEKAGLPPEAWRRPTTVFRRFHADVYREVSPTGPVVHEPLVPSG